ncbi:hypothetical protein Skr01_48850 [Sphaerisporangium krabiense]|uniref:Amino acid adenylation domain-containing protein n=1 Tax=Sphaerisporangium krabiense TaxID=763782 RepID=A0A7W8Z1Z8_9ACTN|nr:AMP-binding protein [Sphaerisporangium krabiense]MBB5625996.1 amino acid adenylation domain-containing protein [Sphaerisporangium krabiense]GII64800.1 hypothetical protein Skr01_48850 [Sphaerisporangium krabiense]
MRHFPSPEPCGAGCRAHGRGGPLTLPTLVEEAAARAPTAIAVIGERTTNGGRATTYGELTRAMRAVAARLASHGVKPGDVVALAAARSARAPALALGIMRAGAVYLPLDPLYPAPLLARMLSAAPVRAVITDPTTGPPPPKAHADLDARELLAPTGAEPPPPPVPCGPAYVMFTSGSTGTPKGVLLGHAGLAEYARALPDGLGLGGTDRCLGVSPLGFSSSIRELLLPLARGATVVVPSEEEVRLPWGVPELVRATGVTHLDLTPSYWRAVTDAMPAGELRTALATVRGVLFASEPLDAGLAHRTRALLPGARVWNMYGCTETTGIVAAHEVDGTEPADALVPIGTPLRHAEVDLCPRAGDPPGTGQVVVTGRCVALGHLDGSDLSDGSSLSGGTDLSSGTGLSGGSGHGRACAVRRWETGDLAVTVRDATVWTGRVDRMRKVRGMRVAPETVEHHLLACPGVRHAAVVGVTERGVTCVVAGTPGGTPPDVAALMAFMRERLPAHMAPVAVTVVADWPLLPNGKSDLRLLTSRHGPHARGAAAT